MSGLTLDHKPQLNSAPQGRDTTTTTVELKPKEHGAYAILAIPIVTALSFGLPSSVGLCVSIAAFAGFFAHEPLLVVLGHRGMRAQVGAHDARYRLIALLSIAGVAGTIALAIGSQPVRLALLLCFILACSSFAIAATGKHRSFAGQAWGVVGLSSPCLPILLSAGGAWSVAFAVWCTWLIGFTATTVAVRGVVAAQKKKPRLVHFACMLTLTVSMVLAFATLGAWVLASLPMLCASWYLLLAPPPAKQLRRIGWTLVAVTVATAIFILAINLGPLT